MWSQASCTTVRVLPVSQASHWHREGSSVLRTPAASISMHSHSADWVPPPDSPFPLIGPAYSLPLSFPHSSPFLHSSFVFVPICFPYAFTTSEALLLTKISPFDQVLDAESPNTVPHMHVSTTLLDSSTPFPRASVEPCCVSHRAHCCDSHSCAQL